MLCNEAKSAVGPAGMYLQFDLLSLFSFILMVLLELTAILQQIHDYYVTTHYKHRMIARRTVRGAPGDNEDVSYNVLSGMQTTQQVATRMTDLMAEFKFASSYDDEGIQNGVSTFCYTSPWSINIFRFSDTPSFRHV
jgi:hypothetical protein